MNSMAQVLEEMFSKAAGSSGRVVRNASNFKVCCSCVFSKCLVFWLESLPEGNVPVAFSCEI